jgi:hypothetical protein
MKIRQAKKVMVKILNGDCVYRGSTYFKAVRNTKAYKHFMSSRFSYLLD